MPEVATITTIIVTYNSAGVIAGALEALVGQPEIASIIVVDNCSTDDTCDLIAREFSSVQVIENPKNDGFGRANNVALEKVTTPYTLLVNPDAVMKEGAITALLKAAAHYPDAAILAPLLYDEQGQLHRSYKRNVFTREKRRDRYHEPSGDLCAEFLSGAVWLLNMELMRKVGLFDRHIFLYYEDDDLCLRVRQAGYGLVLVHNAQAVHLQGTSSGAAKPEIEFFRQQHMAWSRIYIENKYHGQVVAKCLAMRQNLEYAFRAAWYALHFNHAKVNRYRARISGIAKFFDTLPPT